MRIQSALCGLVLMAGAALAPATSEARVDFIVGVAPPPVRVERVPGPRRGYVWTPGYWRWNGSRHVWVGGTWIGERPGWRWEPSHWVAYGPHWHYVPGYWVH